MMSVASTTKTKMLGLLCLGLILVGSISSASASSISENAVFTPAQEQKQDLSVLRKKLGERFAGVTKEVRSLVDGTTSPVESFQGNEPRKIDVSQGIEMWSEENSQNIFIDIEQDPYKSYINRLANYGVLSSSDKFYPQNYFRTEDFIALLAKVYLKKTGKPLHIDADTSSQFLTKATMQTLINGIDGILPITLLGDAQDTLIRSEGAYYIVRAFDLPAMELSTNLESSHGSSSIFSDTIGHPFVNAISTLANLGIVNTQTDKFYPDNYVHHYDFTILFVHAFLAAKGQSLPSTTTSSFADVENSASYLPQLTYAADRGLIDYLVTSKRGQLYFAPNALITKHEVYQILSKTLNIQFTYDQNLADQEKITRGELAQLLVKSFELQYTPASTSSVSDVTSGTALDTGDVSLLKSLKKLLSMI